MSKDDGAPAPLIDSLHRTIWLMENQPRKVGEFLDEASPNREQMRLLAAALAGPGLSGKSDEDRQRLLTTTQHEQSALGKLLANWKTLVPESLFDAGRR
jgi:putative DNA methylase